METELMKSTHNFIFSFPLKGRQRYILFLNSRFDGLKIICETNEPSIIDSVKLTLKGVIDTSNGHKWELV